MDAELEIKTTPEIEEVIETYRAGVTPELIKRYKLLIFAAGRIYGVTNHVESSSRVVCSGQIYVFAGGHYGDHLLLHSCTIGSTYLSGKQASQGDEAMGEDLLVTPEAAV